MNRTIKSCKISLKCIKLDLIGIFNIGLLIIIGISFIFEKNLVMSLIFFLLSILIYLNHGFKFSIYVNFIINIFYTFRILILNIDISQFYYEEKYFTVNSYYEATNILALLIFTINLIFFVSKKYSKQTCLKLDKIDLDLIFIFLVLYFIVQISVAFSTGITIGFEYNNDLKYFIRLSQIFTPFLLLIFMFTKNKLYILLFLSILYSLISGSKAVFYNLLLSYIICSYLNDKLLDKKFFYLFLITLLTIPFVFLISDYVRYSEGMQISSLFNYLLDFKNILSKLSVALDRFAYFDTLVAWITHSTINHYNIEMREYIYDFLSGFNRFVPGDIFNFSYISFENKTVYELKSFALENRIEKKLGYYTESMGLAKFYFLGFYYGSIFFGLLLSIILYAHVQKNILIKSFSYYLIYDILVGTDMQSILVLSLNFLLLLLSFYYLKFFYKRLF